MKKLAIHIACALVFCSVAMKSQDIHFTQFYASPLYLNPAFTGANACARVGLSYRDQWPGIKKAYKSYMLSGDHYLPRYNIGAGMIFASDVAGSGSLKTTLIQPMIAYEAKLARDFGMRFGIQPGITTRSVNYNQLIFGDQIATGTASSVETQKPSTTFLDLGAGVLAYSSKFWAGFSAYHLNKPNQSLLGSEDGIVPIKYSFHAGAKFIVGGDDKSDVLKSITPALHYRKQKKYDQFDVGMYYTHGLLTMGLWYRGLPLKHYQPGYANNDAVAVLLGVKTDRFNCGYSYDLTISKLAGASRGAHELTISYQFCKQKKKKKRIEVACPKF